MAQNFYFNNFENSMEQDLIESLIVESISIYGHSIFYLPRTIIDKDEIFGEDPLSEYNSSYFFDVYIKSYDAYEGDGTFLSKFYTEIRDQITFTIARRTFTTEITEQENVIQRPREGDLIYSSMLKRLFIIKFVNQYPVFYQMGALQTWDIICEVFEYSNERFNTGIDEIDQIEIDHSLSSVEFGIETNDGFLITAGDGYPLVLSQFDEEEQLEDVFGDNEEIGIEGSGIVDWSERDPFSEGITP